MSGLRSAIDEYATDDPTQIADGQLQDDVVELVTGIEQLRAEVLRRLAPLDRRRPHIAQGFRSTTSWLRTVAPISGGDAKAHVAAARALSSADCTLAAMQRGDLSWRKIQVLADFATRYPEAYAANEHVTVDTAIGLSESEVRKLVDYVRQNLDPDGASDDADAEYRRRRLHVSETVDGMIAIDGLLDRVTGAPVLTALRAMAEPGGRDGDPRTPAQRRADALSDLCRDWLDHGDTPVHGGQRPHVTVVVDYEVLRSKAPGRVELNDSVVTADAALRLACDAGICRLITRGATQPLNVGRSTRTVTPAQTPGVEPTRRWLPMGRLRPTRPVVRRPPPRSLDPRWRDRPRQPHPAVPPPPPPRA